MTEYVDDAIDALVAVGVDARCFGEVFNIAAARCCPTPTLLRDVIECAARLEEGRSPSRAATIRRNGLVIQNHDRHVVAIRNQHLNGSRIHDVLGFTPAIAFEDGLTRTVAHYRDYFSRQW